MPASKELKLLFGVAGIYSSFLYWGYLQEKITSVEYVTAEGKSERWTFSFFLNMLMACGAWMAGALIVRIRGVDRSPSRIMFFRAALSNTLASPFGYASLRYISYPLQLLAKSCKLVPVMLMGAIVGGKKYSKSEYFQVIMITVGVSLFSYKPSAKVPTEGGDDASIVAKLASLRELHGLALVIINLMLDGYTNAEQDMINKRLPKLSSFFMMYRVNECAIYFHMLLLGSGYLLWGNESELSLALQFCREHPDVRYNIFAFCLCAAVGQVFIFWIIKEFGSLISVTVTITRKFFSILLSIYKFNHRVTEYQWVGMFAVFLGLMMPPLQKILNPKPKAAADPPKIKVDLKKVD